MERELPRDLACGARARGDGCGPARAVDGDPDTAWVAPGASRGRLTVDLGRTRQIDRIRLVEDIRQGQQVEHALVEAELTDGTWRKVAETGVIGAGRILLLPGPVTARRWRLRITGSRAAVNVAQFGLYRSAV
ncbi:discoidin domain-containing protein [Streptomyces sp. NPDC021093]|uniref:discoidin domain-containing protein n=1 Tax=Streptomyces sp. NPDC021093 TaxID=3365112 RepID=UPI00378E7A5C